MTKKTQKTAVQQTEQEFNYFDFFKFQVLKAYFTKKLKGEKTNEIKVQIKYFDNNKSGWFYKNQAMKFVEWHTAFDEQGHMLVEVVIKDINLDAKAVSKAGKEFKVFSSFDIAKAVKAATKEIAA